VSRETETGNEMLARYALVTGGGGFIGSHLVDALVRNGYEVTVLDNFSSGHERNLSNAVKTGRVKVLKGDIMEKADIGRAVQGCGSVFHFAANPEVRNGDPNTHFEVNIRGTLNVLEEMKAHGLRELIFASSSTVYGDATLLPTSEDYSPMRPISVYGASKLACESLISSYCASYDLKAIILRFANIVGPRLSHGVVYDFMNKLKNDPTHLEILGDGTQRKSYLFVDDAIEAITYCARIARQSFDVFNVGSEDDIEVRRIARIVEEEMRVDNPRHVLTGGVGGGRGWVGDVKFMRLDVTKLKSLGWGPKHSSEDAIRMTVRSIINEWHNRCLV